ncbi:hypothetical protein JCM10212_002034 [Sporobolomyces blumeae]
MHKRRRTGNLDAPLPTRPTSLDLAHSIRRTTSRRPPPGAFSPVANLVALATPRPTDASSDAALLAGQVPFPNPSTTTTTPPPPLSITLTYLSGAPSAASSPRYSFRLAVPPIPSSTSSPVRIKLLSFGPDGTNLLCVSGPDDVEDLDAPDDHVTVFEQSESGCVDQWVAVLHEDVARLGARGKGTSQAHGAKDGKEVVSVRWVGEPRTWFANDDARGVQHGDSPAHPAKPLLCAPPRSAPLSGTAFVAVLSSDEIVFVHLPRTLPLLPNIVCMPLHPPPSALVSTSSQTASAPGATPLSPSQRSLSLTAVPTPPTAVPNPVGLAETMATATGLASTATSTSTATATTLPAAPTDHSTPTASISQLVGSLISTLPLALDASLPLPIAPSPAAGAGNAAMKDELRAAEVANSIEGDTSNGSNRRRRKRKRVRLAEVGSVRSNRATVEAGETTFVVATVTRRSRSKPRTSPVAAGPNTVDASVVPEPLALDGSASNLAPSTSVGAQDAAPTVPELIDLSASLGMSLDDDNFDINALDGFDFGSLDAAFGSNPPPPPATTTNVFDAKDASGPNSVGKSPKKDGNDEGTPSKEELEWDAWDHARADGDDEERPARDKWKIELSEVRIEMAHPDGPRLTVRPQPDFFALPPSTPLDSAPSDAGHDELVPVDDDDAEITRIAFLEDRNIPTVAAPTPAKGSEEAVDLELLVSSTSTGHVPRTYLSTYAFSREACALSDAFAHLECKKAEVAAVELGEWSVRHTASARIPDRSTVTCMSTRSSGRRLATLLAVTAGPPSTASGSSESSDRKVELASKAIVLDSHSLAPIASAETALAAFGFLDRLLVSPNGAVVVALAEDASSGTARPVIAAAPPSPATPEDCARLLATSIVSRRDASDVLGVIVSAYRDPHAIEEILDRAHALLQAQLTSARPLPATSVQFELLGLAAALYGSRSAPPRLDGCERSKVARGLVECAAAARAFAKSERRQRGVEKSATYRCEMDALWPLVGHASWYSQFVDGLVRDALLPSTDTKAAVFLHLLHPVSLSLHSQLCTSILGLSTSLSTLAAAPEPDMGLAEEEMVDLASKVIEDAVKAEQGGMLKWKSVLDKVRDVEGLDPGLASSSALTTLRVPESVYPQAHAVQTILRETYPSVARSSSDHDPLPPSPPYTPDGTTPTRSFEFDVVRRCQLSRTVPSSSSSSSSSSSVGGSNGPVGNAVGSMMKQCLRCGVKSGAVNPTLTTTMAATAEPTGTLRTWAEIEDGWRARCSCGGFWRIV